MLPTMIVVPSVTTMRNAPAGVVGGEVLAVVLALRPAMMMLVVAMVAMPAL